VKGLLLVAALAVASPAVAQVSAVAEAQREGAVGERYDGYLGVAASISDPARKAVASINIKRRALYSGLATRRGVSPQEVGITAACALLGRVAVGEAYLLGDGVWRRRADGQPAPRPNYCG
jgi:uncharacterized protein YdbL (DUF1318 family)